MRSKSLVQRAVNPGLSPKPFDMRERIRYVDDHPAIGAFDRLYHIGSLSDDEVTTLALWLCHNCTENFIFVESTTKILAGGSTNPLLSWQQRHKDRGTHMVDSYQVKLYHRDVTFFELTWLNDRGFDG